jgi:hypothetical protein
LAQAVTRVGRNFLSRQALIVPAGFGKRRIVRN